MSPRQPRITSSELLAALRRDGWEIVRRTGSHAQLKHSTKPGRVTVATHANRVIDAKTLASALRQAGLTPDQLRDLL
ncbi:MAG TPA: type II toxin-antitoxin system HicA family toxin [Chloroflexota bacterium]|nr:type II toxin-antitoxin system HicA family toxin [Chloroflexota bacterium]